MVDIRKLYDQADIFTYDPGFTSTASTESNITFIDGDKGVLQYRGYPIADLAEHSNFLETCYLLLYGELPNQAQMEEFSHSITHHTMVHEQMASFFRGFRRDAHPWRSCAAWWARCRPSITTPPTSTIRASARSPATAWSPRCPPSRRWRSNITSASPSCIR